MQKLLHLKPGDYVEIIAPASRCTEQRIIDLKELIHSWQLECILDKDIFGDDILCANSDEKRFKFLSHALLNPKTKAIICVRGGYGSMRLIPALSKITPPATAKILVGMSDMTALHLYLQQHWQWPTIHGAAAIDKFSMESINTLKSLLFGEIKQVEFAGIPLNLSAEKNHLIESSVTGGNLTLVQTSIGTIWQLDGRNKIIFLEEVGERGFRVDRMLEHLQQATIFKDAAAIVFGDFINCLEPNGSSLIKPIVRRFAENINIPVVQIEGIGHGPTNFPMALGTEAKLQLGYQTKLICYR